MAPVPAGPGRRVATSPSRHPTAYTRDGLQLQYFEELALGAEWTTRRRTVTEADVVNFSNLAGDLNPLHVDVEYARKTEFGSVVIPAGLLVALAVGLGSVDVPTPATVAMLGMSWKFVKPLKPGDTIHARWRLVRKRAVENPRWGLAVWRVEVLDQTSEVAVEGEVARVVTRVEPEKPAAPASRRRRRRRAGAAAAVIDQPVPESAPSDTPPPNRRRRREPAAAPAAEGGPEVPRTGSPRRRRRRRSSNGAGTAQAGGGDTAPVAVAPPEPVRSEPAAAPPPVFQPLNEVTPARGEPEPTGVGRVLRRLRGRRPEGGEGPG